MWIRTQNKQRIINSDQVVDIFIDKSGTKILAEVTADRDFITLGEYANRDICLKMIEYLSAVIGSNMPVVMLPLGGEVDTWCKDVLTLLRNLGKGNKSQKLHTI